MMLACRYVQRDGRLLNVPLHTPWLPLTESHSTKPLFIRSSFRKD